MRPLPLSQKRLGGIRKTSHDITRPNGQIYFEPSMVHPKHKQNYSTDVIQATLNTSGSMYSERSRLPYVYSVAQQNTSGEGQKPMSVLNKVEVGTDVYGEGVDIQATDRSRRIPRKLKAIKKKDLNEGQVELEVQQVLPPRSSKYLRGWKLTKKSSNKDMLLGRSSSHKEISKFLKVNQINQPQCDAFNLCRTDDRLGLSLLDNVDRLWRDLRGGASALLRNSLLFLLKFCHIICSQQVELFIRLFQILGILALTGIISAGQQDFLSVILFGLCAFYRCIPTFKWEATYCANSCKSLGGSQNDLQSSYALINFSSQDFQGASFLIFSFIYETKIDCIFRQDCFPLSSRQPSIQYMSVYSGFGTRVQETTYAQLTETLLGMLSNRILLENKGEPFDEAFWATRLIQLHNKMNQMELQKYIPPKLSENFGELITHLNSKFAFSRISSVASNFFEDAPQPLPQQSRARINNSLDRIREESFRFKPRKKQVRRKVPAIRASKRKIQVRGRSERLSNSSLYYQQLSQRYFSLTNRNSNRKQQLPELKTDNSISDFWMV